MSKRTPPRAIGYARTAVRDEEHLQGFANRACLRPARHALLWRQEILWRLGQGTGGRGNQS